MVCRLHRTVMPSSELICLERLHDPRRVARIERGDRLIREHNRRLLHQSPGDRDALLLPPRQGVGTLERVAGEVEPLQRLNRHARSTAVNA